MKPSFDDAQSDLLSMPKNLVIVHLLFKLL